MTNKQRTLKELKEVDLSWGKAQAKASMIASLCHSQDEKEK